MKSWPCLTTGLLIIAAAAGSPARSAGIETPAQEYALGQNDPEPFCASTSISFALPVEADVDLSVWSPDSTAVVRSLVVGHVTPGYHLVLWDGMDNSGHHLSNGSYPYVLTVVPAPGEPPAFVASHRATVDCPSPTNMGTWGAIRAIFR